MTIKRKATKAVYVQTDMIEDHLNEDKIKEVVSRGGSTIEELSEKKTDSALDLETRFTLRTPSDLIGKIDAARKQRVGNVSRNQWILEAISQALK